MPNLSESELQKIQKNLHVGKCPNCGFDGEKILAPMDGAILSLVERGVFDSNGMRAINVIFTTCPECGFISLFSKGVIME